MMAQSQSINVIQHAVEQSCEAALGGDRDAQYDMGRACLKGTEDIAPNLNSAIFFLNLAAEAEHADAQATLADLYSDAKHIEPDEEIAFYWWSRAAANGNLQAKRRLAGAYAMGLYLEEDIDTARILYDDLVRQNEGNFPYAFMKAIRQQEGCAGCSSISFFAGSDCCVSYDVGLGHLIGLHYPRNLEKARSYLSHASTEGDHPLATQYLRWLEKGYFSQGIVRHVALLNEILSQDLPSCFSNCFIRSDDELGGGYDDILAVCTAIVDLALRHNDKNSYFYYKNLTILQALSQGVSVEQLSNQAKNLGPVFNRISAEGVLVPGQYDHNNFTRGGFKRVVGISFSNGYCSVIGEQSKKGVVHLTYDDIDVAKILAFLVEDYPSFSLESPNSVSESFRLQEKVFTPAWLEYTDFGKSLFLADLIMKGITGKQKLVNLIDPFGAAATDCSGPDFKVLHRLKTVFGQAVTQRGRLMLNLDKIHVLRSSHERILLDGIDINITGAGISIDSDGDEIDRHVRENDPLTAYGHQAAHMTRNYDEMSRLFPVFERVRQLLGLTKLLRYARDCGVILEPKEQRRLRRKLQSLQMHGQSHWKARLHPIPAGRDYSLYGGVSMANAKVNITKEQELKPKQRPQQGAKKGGNASDYSSGRLSSMFDNKSQGCPSITDESIGNRRSGKWEVAVEQIRDKSGRIAIQVSVGTNGYLHKDMLSGGKKDHFTGHVDGTIHRHGYFSENGRGSYDLHDKWYDKKSLVGGVIDKGGPKDV